MGDIRFLCPSCGKKLSISPGSVDLVVNCPECQKPILAWGAPLLDIRFHCPKCGVKLQVDSRLMGEAIGCPSCRAPVAVPKPVQAMATLPADTPQEKPPRSLISEAEIKFLSGEGSEPAKS